MASDETEEKLPTQKKRIEWKSTDKKQHDVVLFGSWNKYLSGYELQYVGKQKYVVDVDIPIGNYNYRFLIDAEDWDTNNGTKIFKDGNEYNTIRISLTTDSSDDEDDEEDDVETDEKDDNKNTQLIFDQSKNAFVVGKQKRKRKGRQSMELDLGQDFQAEAAAADEEDANADQESDTTTTDTSQSAGGASTTDKSSKKKKKKKKNTQI